MVLGGCRKILFLTGTRADFGKMKPLMEQVERSADFECIVFVTGMHMLARYGDTLIEVRKAGFQNIFPYFNQTNCSPTQMDRVLASTIEGLSNYIRELPPDLIVVHGDRVEALAGATVGALNNILVAHVEGGELSGTVDELIRHAVSKLSQRHFVANQPARRRLLQMGESDESIFCIGSPEVDVMLGDTLPTLDEVRRYYDIGFADYGIFIYHPVTTERQRLGQQIDTVVAGLRESGWNFVVIYPNNDTGSEQILDAILPLRADPRFRLLPSMRFEYFLTLMKHARAMVGNSSAGVREAPVFGVPTINIGTRQANRSACPSIIHIPEQAEKIVHALRNPLPPAPPSRHFGGGDSARLFMAALRQPTWWQTSPQKQFRDRLAEA